jgi:GTP pyrophosphokinase
VLTKWLSGETDELRRAAEAEAERLRKSNTAPTAPRTQTDALVIDESINNIVYKLAKCCNPIKGDDIFGFVTINSGITIHRNDCPNAKRMRETYPYRIMEARWRDHAQGSFRVTIAITAHNATGLANQITEIITRELKLNIRGMNLSSRADGSAFGTVSVEVPSATVVDMLIHSIMKIKGVQRVYRAQHN